MIRLLYTLAIQCYSTAVRIAALWNTKARQMARGWKNMQLPTLSSKLSSSRVAWFHVSSLGEFEQSRPVIAAFRESHPDYKICLTFFSPSGYEVRKDCPDADIVSYLLPDTPRNARRFLDTVHPDIAFFVKYDYWFNYLHQLHLRGIPTYIFSAILRPGQYFFRPYGKWFLNQLRRCFTHIFVQNQTSLDLLRQHGIDHCSLAGDTRFDRVHAIALNAPNNDVVRTFLDLHSGKPVLLAGSSWEPDEQNLRQYLDHRPDILLILAPHVIAESHLAQIETLFGKENCLRYSQISTLTPQHTVLIIDNIGLLASLYQYADVAYIGGGFGRGIHNILEAVTFGKPVVFGPNYHKFQEACDIIQCGGGFSYQTYPQLQKHLDNLLDNPPQSQKASDACRQYLTKNLGSTRKILSKLTLLSLILILLSSCSASKYLQPDERVLYNNVINVQMIDSTDVPKEVNAVAKSASKYLSQKPNKRLLGTRAGMRLYCSTNPSDTSWWGNLWREQGEPPVVYNEELAQQSARQLEKLMVSKGCFKSWVTFDTISHGSRDVTVRYTIHASQRYKIDEINYRSVQQDILQLLQQWRDNSNIKLGDWYDQETLQDERRQIASFLQQRGYYYASPSLIHFFVDTTYDPRLLSILVSVRQPQTTDNDGRTHPFPLQIHHIDNIYIYPSPSARQGTTTSSSSPDTLVHPLNTRLGKTNYNFIHNGSFTPSPTAISRAIHIFAGQTYRPSIVSNTTNALLDLGNFKFIDISFSPSPNSQDTNRLLDARIRLTNAPQRRISLSLELTNGSAGTSSDDNNFFTSGNFGLGQNLSYHNNNLFGGAEQFTLEENILIESPKNVLWQRHTQSSPQTPGFYNIFSSFELDGTATLDLPQFLLPFTSSVIWQRNKPHTLISLTTDYLYRIVNTSSLTTLFEDLPPDNYTLERIRFSTSFGYTWNHQRTQRHKLMPLNASYTHTLSGDEYFIYLFLITKDIRYMMQTDNYLLLNTHYQYTYTDQQPGVRTNFRYLRLTAETAGNLLTLINNAAGKPLSPDHAVDYYQYARLDAEYKHYYHIGQRQTLVLRALLGIGVPYGHSQSLPYEKMFHGGGPTTMRAWQVRCLGPGQFPARSIQYPISIGDIQLIANIEHRFPLFSILEGAIFTDIGNIFDLSDFGIRQQTPFQPSTFLLSIACGAGFGLRANISFITLRLDLALPIYDPGYDPGDRWITNHFSANQLVANFGVNYPF